MLLEIANKALSTLCHDLLVLLPQLLNQFVLLDIRQVHTKISRALSLTLTTTPATVVRLVLLGVPRLLRFPITLPHDALDLGNFRFHLLSAESTIFQALLRSRLANLEGAFQLDLG